MSPPPDAGLVRGRRRAILLLLAAAATFAIAAGCVKALAGAVPLAQVILARNVFALPLLLLLVPRAGGWRALRPRAPRWHLARLVCGGLGMIGAFASYAALPLATAMVLQFTMPLFLTAMSALLLRETVGWRRWSAVLAGFAGVLLVARPGGEEAALPLVPVLLALLGGLGWALAMMSIRRLGDAGEQGVTIVIWFAIGAAVVSGIATIPVWLDPDPRQWALLVAIGVVSAVAQLLMTEAYRRGETTLLAPFEYSGLIWTMLLGAVIWGEWPGVVDLLGFTVLVGAGLFIWWRETRVAGRR
jgi:drug/metabolite transporter (DMT)-like permease